MANSELKKHKLRAQTKFNEYVRLRDCYETTNSSESALCFTCGKSTDNDKGQLHASHFILDSKSGNSTSFYERNVHACCKRCNRYLNGNLVNYAINLVKKYGQEELNNLSKLKLINKKWTISDLDEIYEKYKSKIADLLE